MKKQNEGVTLIALIITIIVLLILATITIAMVIGENGIIQKAQIAKEKTEEAQGKENQQISDLENKLQEYSSRNISNVNGKLYQFRNGNNGFTSTEGEIEYTSLGAKAKNYISKEESYDGFYLICKIENNLESSIILNSTFEISSQIAFDNRNAINIGGIYLKFYKRTGTNYEIVNSMRIRDGRSNANYWELSAQLNDKIFGNNTWQSTNGSGMYALVGDGSKINFYWENTLLGSIDYSEKLQIDKIEIVFAVYNEQYNEFPCIIRDLYIGEPLNYKSFVNEKGVIGDGAF